MLFFHQQTLKHRSRSTAGLAALCIAATESVGLVGRSSMGWQLSLARTLRLAIRKSFFSIRVVRYWNRMSWVVVESPCLAVFRKRADIVLTWLVAVVRILVVFPCLKDSVILWSSTSVLHCRDQNSRTGLQEPCGVLLYQDACGDTSSDSPQTPLAMRSCFVQSLEPHSRAYSIIPCSLWIVYPKSHFWKTYQRLYWAVRDKESMSHSYSWLKDLQKLKVTDSILSCREVSLEESQQAEWCKIKPPGILWISHIVLYSYFFD